MSLNDKTTRGSSGELPGGDGSRWVLSDLLLAAADGELSAEQEASLSRLAEEPEAAARIEFDRNLRAACARVLRVEAEAAPVVGSDLRSSVERIVRASRPGDVPSDAGNTSAITHAAQSREVVHRAGRGESGRRLAKAGWVALAACTLVMGVVIGMRLAGPAPTFNTAPDRARIALVGFLESEHRRCALNDRSLRNKMTVYDFAEMPAKLAGLLGKELSVAAVAQAGYEFLGSGKCAVPGRGESVHLIFRDTSLPIVSEDERANLKRCDPTRLSLFIQQDTGEIPITPGKTYILETADDEPLVALWRRDGLIYYLVCESGSQQDQIIDALGIEHGRERL